MPKLAWTVEESFEEDVFNEEGELTPVKAWYGGSKYSAELYDNKATGKMLLVVVGPGFSSEITLDDLKTGDDFSDTNILDLAERDIVSYLREELDQFNGVVAQKAKNLTKKLANV